MVNIFFLIVVLFTAEWLDAEDIDENVDSLW